PWLAKGERIGLELASVSLEPHGEFLTIARGQRPPGRPVRYITYRKVIKHQAKCTHESDISTPSSGKLNLVGRLFFYYIFDIHRSVSLIGNRVDLDFFRIKVAHLCQLTLRVDQVCLTELLSGKGH